MSATVAEAPNDPFGMFEASGGVTGRVGDLRDTQGVRPLRTGRIFQFVVKKFVFGGPFSCINLPIEKTNPKEIAEYIVENPVANEVVEETYSEAKDYFPEADFRLDVYRDPGGGMNPKLALYIQTEDEPEDALNKLDQFDQDFWLDRLESHDPYLQVHLEYQ